jgi:hypothetical protein
MAVDLDEVLAHFPWSKAGTVGRLAALGGGDSAAMATLALDRAAVTAAVASPRRRWRTLWPALAAIVGIAAICVLKATSTAGNEHVLLPAAHRADLDEPFEPAPPPAPLRAANLPVARVLPRPKTQPPAARPKPHVIHRHTATPHAPERDLDGEGLFNPLSTGASP